MEIADQMIFESLHLTFCGIEIMIVGASKLIIEILMINGLDK